MRDAGGSDEGHGSLCMMGERAVCGSERHEGRKIYINSRQWALNIKDNICGEQ